MKTLIMTTVTLVIALTINSTASASEITSQDIDLVIAEQTQTHSVVVANLNSQVVVK